MTYGKKTAGHLILISRPIITPGAGLSQRQAKYLCTKFAESPIRFNPCYGGKLT